MLRSMSILRLAVLWITAFTPATLSSLQTIPGRYDFGVDLHGRYPAFLKNEAFRTWSGRTELGPWHETAIDAKGQREVVLQNAIGDKLFAAIVSSRSGVLSTWAAIDLVPLKQTRSDILGLTASRMAEAQIHAVRPVVIFVLSGRPSVYWEVETIDASGIKTFQVRNGRVSTLSFKRIPSAPGPTISKSNLTADDMADNEIHHLAAFRIEATAWVSGATTVQQKVHRIFDHVRDEYSYDGTIQYISEFTWADYLTRDLNGRRGICDEWAVVVITYLRSVGIPARLKLLIWDERGSPQGHAALEYSDGGTWRSLDALWNSFNDAAIYRRLVGATNVTVMDADYPSDSLSTIPAWGVPDPTGDGKLYPYGDFVIRPAYPGNSRPGYSY